MSLVFITLPQKKATTGNSSPPYGPNRPGRVRLRGPLCRPFVNAASVRRSPRRCTPGSGRRTRSPCSSGPRRDHARREHARTRTVWAGWSRNATRSSQDHSPNRSAPVAPDEAAEDPLPSAAWRAGADIHAFSQSRTAGAGKPPTWSRLITRTDDRHHPTARHVPATWRPPAPRPGTFGNARSAHRTSARLPRSVAADGSPRSWPVYSDHLDQPSQPA